MPMDSTRWQQVSALLDELFVLDEAQQNLRLSRIEREDAALADELRHILAADAASSILDVNVAHAAPTVMRRLDESGAHTPVAVVETGKRVGHYHLIERIGVQSATVYRQVVNALPAHGHRPPVEVRPEWYY